MSEQGNIEPLVMDLVEFVARRPRPYAEVMDAWRTSCPRLPVWEEAVARGLVAVEDTVRATPAGLMALRHDGRLPNRLH